MHVGLPLSRPAAQRQAPAASLLALHLACVWAPRPGWVPLRKIRCRGRMPPRGAAGVPVSRLELSPTPSAGAALAAGVGVARSECGGLVVVQGASHVAKPVPIEGELLRAEDGSRGGRAGDGEWAGGWVQVVSRRQGRGKAGQHGEGKDREWAGGSAQAVSRRQGRMQGQGCLVPTGRAPAGAAAAGLGPHASLV